MTPAFRPLALLLLAGLAPLAARALPLVVDLNLAPGSATNAPSVKAFGRVASEGLGSSIHSGDLNADGVDDLIIAAETSSFGAPNRDQAGAVYVWFGSTGLTNQLDAAGTDGAAPDLTIWGGTTGDHLSEFGAVGLWDLNGDGKNDLVLGASRAEGPAFGSGDNRGEVYILFGKTNFPALVDLAGLAGPEADVRISGASPGDELSRDNALRAADVNGDGRLDLLLGASFADGPANARGNAGEAYVVHGRANFPPTLDLASQASLTLFGPTAGDVLTSRGALRAGDVDGDGIADLLLGAPLADGPGEALDMAGEAYLVFGRTNFPSTLDLMVPGTNGASVTFYGGAGDQLTWMDGVALGDVSGDGLADIVLASPFADGPGEARASAGEAYIVLGRPGAKPYPPSLDMMQTGTNGADVIVYGATAGDELNGSESTLLVRDVTGDGTGDVILSARLADGPGELRSNAGEVYVVAGRVIFPSILDLSLSGTNGATVTMYGLTSGQGPLGGDNKVATGDVNGDGVEDLLLGYRQDAGNRASVVLGRKSPAVFPDTLDLTAQGPTGADMTLTTSSFSLNGGPVAGDVNGDGVKDLLLSARIRSGPGGTRSGAGQAYVVAERSPVGGFHLGVGAMAYQFGSAGSPNGFPIAPNATLEAPEGSLNGGSLVVAITAGYSAGVDTMSFRTVTALPIATFSASAASGSGIQLGFDGRFFGTATIAGNTVTCSLNNNASGAAVAALLADLRYENTEFDAEWFVSVDVPYPSRTFTITLSDAVRELSRMESEADFPTIHAVFFRPNYRGPETDETSGFVYFCLQARFSNGQEDYVPNLQVHWTRVSDDGPLIDVGIASACANVEITTRSRIHFTVRAGNLPEAAMALIHNRCLYAWFGAIAKATQLAGLAGNAEGDTVISLASFHALESLFKTTSGGTRLAELYWRHTQEVRDILVADPALMDQTLGVALIFQPAVIALLSGQSDSMVITQEMINQFKSVLDVIAARAQAGLQADLAAERLRWNDLQGLVEKTPAQIAAQFDIGVPASPYVRISDVYLAPGSHRLTANAPDGVTPALWRSPDLLNWSPVPNFQVQTTNSTFRLTDPAPPAGPVLYQIRW